MENETGVTVIIEGSEHESHEPEPGTAPGVSVEALRLIEESATLRANLDTFRAELRALADRLDAHASSNAADFAELHERLDLLEGIAETAEEIAEAATAAAEVALAAEAGAVAATEPETLDDETPASVEAAEALEPQAAESNTHESGEQKKRRAFISL